jgi:SAM-dependent methyltransferase
MANPDLKPTERFSERVAYYVKYRPGYPPEVIRFLTARLGLTSAAAVADLGSGTGISAKLFLENGNVVYGIEPNREMRVAAEAYLQAYPNFRSIEGTAEATTLPAQSVDLVVAAQAFHWFNVPAARSEAQRILKPGSWAVLLWNDRLTAGTPFLEAFEDLLVRYGTDYMQVNHRNAKDLDAQAITAFFGHAAWQVERFPNWQLFDHEGLRGRVLSSSYSPLPGQPNFEPMMQRLQEIFDEHQVGGQVRFEYQTQVFYGQLGGEA